MLFFISLVLRQKREEVGQADPINTMVPAVAREMHKLGFDQEKDKEGTDSHKEGTDFSTFKIFSGQVLYLSQILLAARLRVNLAERYNRPAETVAQGR